MMGLPYLLGDKDPKDPINGWDKTWAFLKDINSSIEYYPSRTGDVMNELGNGTRAMTPSTLGWDLYPRVTGTVPKDDKTVTLKGTTLVADAQFVLVPKGLDSAREAVVLDLIGWMLKPDQQAIAYDQGYFYPGPAVKGVTLAMAPADSQKAITDFGRPEYDTLIKNTTIVMPLDPKNLVAAFDKWDKEIGQGKVKTPPPPTATPVAAATAAATAAK
jgi:putative spermidine/putrescine transport system substrate-binding protein